MCGVWLCMAGSGVVRVLNRCVPEVIRLSRIATHERLSCCTHQGDWLRWEMIDGAYPGT